MGASSDVEFSTQAAQDRAIMELKSQAARIGANGVLLISAGDGSGDMVGFVSGGEFLQKPSKLKLLEVRRFL